MPNNMVSISNSDFKARMDNDKFYVDKSMLVSDIIENGDDNVYLFTRPRRFGKSLNMSMLDAFFNADYKGNKWFDGLEISKHPKYDSYKNRFPVIYLDLRSEYFESFEGFKEAIDYAIQETFGMREYLLDSDIFNGVKKEKFLKYYTGSLSVFDSQVALKFLSSMLHDFYSEKVVVIIDEYDNTLNNCTNPILRKQILDFLRGFLSHLLKGNGNIQFGVVTGVLQITKENLFSGLNNVLSTPPSEIIY